jgi:hypothetical protein
LLYDYRFKLVRKQCEIKILRADSQTCRRHPWLESSGDVLFFELNDSLRNSFFSERSWRHYGLVRLPASVTEPHDDIAYLRDGNLTITHYLTFDSLIHEPGLASHLCTVFMHDSIIVQEFMMA